MLSESILKELESKQNLVAAFITGLPKSGGTTALHLESGLVPITTRYHVGLYRFFHRLIVSDSDLIQHALIEHKTGKWESPYRNLILKITLQYKLSGMTNLAAKSRIMEVAWVTLMRDVY